MIIIEGEEQEIELEFKLIEQSNEDAVLTIEKLANSDELGVMDD